MSLTHIFTLGFISSAIMGVMYRYVPALAMRPVPYPRIAVLQFAAYEIGVAGMLAHFAIGSWTRLWWSAGLVLTSGALFALDLLVLLWAGIGRGAAETRMFAAHLLFAFGASMLLWSAEGFAAQRGYGNRRSSGVGAKFIVRMSYQLYPGFLVRARTAVGLPALNIAAMSTRRLRSFILAGLQRGPWRDCVGVHGASAGSWQRWRRARAHRGPAVHGDHVLDVELSFSYRASVASSHRL